MNNRHQSAVIRRYQRIAKTYNQFAKLAPLMAERLLEKLDFITIQPNKILDIGCGTGQLLPTLKKKFKKAQVIGADLSIAMLQQAQKQRSWFARPKLICADAYHLPFASNTFDLIISNAVLTLCPDMPNLFKEVKRVLQPQGLFLFTTLGPDTLKELRAAWQQQDDYQHINTLIDMHDIGDCLLQAGFENPVMDMEYVTIMFNSLKQLILELRASGSLNTSSQQKPSCITPGQWQRLESSYVRINEKLPATAEIIYGHGWGKAERTTESAQAGEVSISIHQIGKRY